MQRELSEQLTELIPRMRRFASGLCGSRDHGDELVQAACERLLQHQSRLRPDTRLDSWLYRVIRNLHVDSVRSQTVRDRGAQQIRLNAESEPATHNNLDNHLRLHEIQQALLQLSEEHRSALMLICVEGLTYKEAAEVLQVPMGTVTSRLGRARKALVAQIGEEARSLDLEASNE